MILSSSSTSSTVALWLFGGVTVGISQEYLFEKTIKYTGCCGACRGTTRTRGRHRIWLGRFRGGDRLWHTRWCGSERTTRACTRFRSSRRLQLWAGRKHTPWNDVTIKWKSIIGCKTHPLRNPKALGMDFLCGLAHGKDLVPLVD